jgi:hypothetical protein
MPKFLKSYLLTIVKPRKTFEGLLTHKEYFSLGFAFILIPIVAYTLIYVFLTIGHGAPSVFTPWLNIPKEVYYSINRFLLAPSMILCWIVSSAIAQILSRIFKGTGCHGFCPAKVEFRHRQLAETCLYCRVVMLKL